MLEMSYLKIRRWSLNSEGQNRVQSEPELINRLCPMVRLGLVEVLKRSMSLYGSQNNMEMIYSILVIRELELQLKARPLSLCALRTPSNFQTVKKLFAGLILLIRAVFIQRD